MMEYPLIELTDSFWCMVNNDAAGEYIDWLKYESGMPGVSHDGHNTVYPLIPPDEYSNYFYHVPEEMYGDSLISFVGSFLSNNSNRCLIADRAQFVFLYNTPHWRLWCANYEGFNIESFSDDKQFFGLDESLTQQECHEIIWQGFKNGE